MDITPRDTVETKALNIGQRITTAIGILIAMGATLLAAFGDVKWIADHLPLLGTGLGALTTGALASYVAVRRMRIDKTKTAAVLCLLASGLMLSGCAVISGKAGESHYMGLAFGEKASSTLAGLNITETQTDKGKIVTERGVGIDKAGSAGEADMGKILGNLLLLGLQSQGIPVKATASTASQADSTACDVDTASDVSAPSTDTAAVSYSADGYSGAPGAGGIGVYGHPTCSRCRAYHTAHPEVQIINIDTPANLSAMWSALRARGFTATSASLPVSVTASAYTLSAK